MAVSMNVRTVIEPEAAARIRTLAVDREFDQMLEHAATTIPSLRRIHVRLAEDPEGADDARILMEAIVENDSQAAISVEWNWATWMTRTFSPQVFQHFVLLTASEVTDGR